MSAAEEKAPGGTPNTVKQCRMYEEEFPELETCIMVQVKSIAEMGAYVSLLEYNGIEGMILLSELSRRRIRSINKLIRVGKNEVVMAIRVDKEKGAWFPLFPVRGGGGAIPKARTGCDRALAFFLTPSRPPRAGGGHK
jgi:hypothetical protein